MDDGHKRVLERIRKLLSLAGNNDSLEEAALATAIAAKLMERHSIHQADVDTGDEKEDIAEQHFGPPLRRKSTWQGALAKAIANAFGCATVWSGSSIIIAGRLEDVEMAVIARDYCHHEINRLTAFFAAGRGRQFGVSFRMGCVHAIHEAIEKEREALREELRGHVSETALVVVDQREAEARESFGKTKKVRSSTQLNDLAYATGVVTGRDIYQGTKPRVEG